MKKSLIDMIQDYVDARLAVGGCLLGIIGVGFAIWCIKYTIKMFTGMGQLMLSIGLALLVFIIAMTVATTAKSNGDKKGAVVLFAGAILQIVLCVIHFHSSDIVSGCTDIAFVIWAFVWGRRAWSSFK